jgi:outer membrane protein
MILKSHLISCKRNACSIKRFFILLVLHALIFNNVFAKDTLLTDSKWSFQTRMIMTGSSDVSDPVGYTVYSAFSIEPTITRKISSQFSLAFKARTESHEVDFKDSSESEIPLGSIELLPLNLFLQYDLFHSAKARMYIGAGGNLTFCWEKSGVLNSTDLPPSFGPALQLGTDLNISKCMFMNFEIGWNSLQMDILSGGDKISNLKMDPINLGIGLGYKF